MHLLYFQTHSLQSGGQDVLQDPPWVTFNQRAPWEDADGSVNDPQLMDTANMHRGFILENHEVSLYVT